MSTDAQTRHAGHLRLMSGVLGASFLFYAVRNVALGRPRTAVLQTVGFAAMIALFLFVRRERRAGRLVLATHVFLASMLVIAGAITLSNGLAATSVPWILSALTLPAAYLLGTREGIAWASIAAVGMVVLGWGARQRFVEPEFVLGTPELALQLAWFHVMVATLAIAARAAADRHIEAVESQKETIAAQSEELQRAHDAALHASSAKSAFLATVTHELRTPLHAILGMTSVVAESSLDPAQREAMATIQRSADALSALIGDVLDYSKIEAGKIELNAEPVELLELAEQAVDMVAFAASARGIGLVQRRPSISMARVVVDPLRVRQVLTNLLSNAVKFSEKGTIEIAVVELPAPGSEGVVELQVRDEGVGLTPEEADRLFVPFSQASADTARRFGGTGLGLAISRAIAEQLGGSVRIVESAPGRGTTFGFRFLARAVEPEKALLGALHVGVFAQEPEASDLLDLVAYLGAVPSRVVELTALPRDLDALFVALRGDESHATRVAIRDAKVPVVIAAAVGTPVEEASRVVRQPLRSRAVATAFKEAVGRLLTPPPVTPATPTVSLSVLVVDDDPINRMVMVRMLERAGHHPEVASDGRAALARVAAERFDVALLDMRMPGLDGPTTAREIIQAHGVDRPRLIALTANASAHDRATCLSAGMDDFLSKPLRLPELRAALADVRPHAEGPVDFDTRVLAELAALPGGDGGLLGELSGVFFADAPRRLRALRDALAKEQREALTHEAHSIKGAAGTLGFRRIAHVAAELEARSKAEGGPILERLVEELRVAIEHAETQLPRRLLTPLSLGPR